MDAHRELETLLDRAGFRMEVTRVLRNPHMEPSPHMEDHFQVIVSSDLGEIDTFYSVGTGIVEQWGRKEAPGYIRALFRNAPPKTVAFQEAMAAARTRFTPNLVDVVGCLLMDASAVDYDRFEDWASDLGYDTDSRKAESTFRICRDHGMVLRTMLGDSFEKACELAHEL